MQNSFLCGDVLTVNDDSDSFHSNKSTFMEYSIDIDEKIANVNGVETIIINRPIVNELCKKKKDLQTKLIESPDFKRKWASNELRKLGLPDYEYLIEEHVENAKSKEDLVTYTVETIFKRQSQHALEESGNLLVINNSLGSEAIVLKIDDEERKNSFEEEKSKNNCSVSGSKPLSTPEKIDSEEEILSKKGSQFNDPQRLSAMLDFSESKELVENQTENKSETKTEEKKINQNKSQLSISQQSKSQQSSSYNQSVYSNENTIKIELKLLHHPENSPSLSSIIITPHDSSGVVNEFLVLENQNLNNDDSEGTIILRKVTMRMLNSLPEAELCQICLCDSEQNIEGLTCGHRFCNSCFKSYLENQIMISKVQGFKCPQEGCLVNFNVDKMSSHLDDKMIKKYKLFKLRLDLAEDRNIKFCIRPDCDKYLKCDPEKDIHLKCECGMEFCFRCSNPWHPGKSCEAVIDKDFRDYLKKNLVQTCPKCKSNVEKAIGCNHMACSICQYNWCWLCGGKYSTNHYHPMNPFGCPGLQASHFQKSNYPKKKIYLIRCGMIIAWFCFIINIPIIISFELGLYLPRKSFHLFSSISEYGASRSCFLNLLCKILIIFIFLVLFALSFAAIPFRIIKFLTKKCCRFLWARNKKRFRNRHILLRNNIRLEMPHPAPLNVRIQRNDELRNLHINGDDDVPEHQLI